MTIEFSSLKQHIIPEYHQIYSPEFQVQAQPITAENKRTQLVRSKYIIEIHKIQQLPCEFEEQDH